MTAMPLKIVTRRRSLHSRI